MNDNEILIVLDVETTGLDYQREKIIEFAAVKLINGVITEEFETLINPQQDIRHSSIKIHGITQDMVADAPNLEDVLPAILEFIGDYPIIGHNVIFDYNFLNQASKLLYGKEIINHIIDTQYMFREVFPEEFSHGLEALMNRMEVEFTTRHRAMADTKGLALAYPKLKQLYDQKYSWQQSQLKNINYLFERYLRIQQAIQTMQSELADIKSVFKIYFEEGGADIQSSTGELLTYNSKTSYSYDFDSVKETLEEIGAFGRAVKLNNGLIDRMIDGISLSEEKKIKLSNSRKDVSESRSVNIVKPDRNISDFSK
jgi:DNA polymerase III epsilon subunit family exonuclease